MWEDQIVAQVRQVRQAYAAKYGYDLRALYRALKAQEECEDRPKVTFSPKCVETEAQTITTIATYSAT